MFKIIIYFSGFKPALVQSEINSFWLQLHSALTFLHVRLRFQLFAKFGINRKGWSQIPPALKNWYVPTSVPIWHLINSVSLLELEVSSSFWLFLFFLLLFSSLPNWHDIKEQQKSEVWVTFKHTVLQCYTTTDYMLFIHLFFYLHYICICASPKPKQQELASR